MKPQAHLHVCQSGNRLRAISRKTTGWYWRTKFYIPKLKGNDWIEYDLFKQMVFDDILKSGAHKINYEEHRFGK